MYSFKFLLIER